MTLGVVHRSGASSRPITAPVSAPRLELFVNSPLVTKEFVKLPTNLTMELVSVKPTKGTEGAEKDVVRQRAKGSLTIRGQLADRSLGTHAGGRICLEFPSLGSEAPAKRAATQAAPGLYPWLLPLFVVLGGALSGALRIQRVSSHRKDEFSTFFR
jgi:hypothetical protein